MVLSKEIHGKLQKRYADKGPNDHIGEPIDAPVGHAPRVVKVPMHPRADVNPKFHQAKEEEKVKKTPDVNKGIGWTAKDERMYNHVKESDASTKIAAATVNKQRRKEGRTKMQKGTPNVRLIAKGGPGSGPKKGGKALAPWQQQQNAVKEATAAHFAKLHGSGAPAGSAVALTHAPSSGKVVGMHNMSEKAHEASHVADAENTVELHHAAAKAHEDAGDFHQYHPKGDPEKVQAHHMASMNHRKMADKITKWSAPPKVVKGVSMSKNEASDLFKAELGNDPRSPITSCVHCKHPLTHDDLHKGLGTQFVVDDNDNPSSGSGQVDPSRPGAGVSENDAIAPLLKSCKGPEAGEGEEFPISKSEMAQMGMEVGEMEDGWYTISKSEMVRVGAEEHVPYLAGRKTLISKAMPKEGPKTKPSFTPHKPLTSGNWSAPPLKKGEETSETGVERLIRKGALPVGYSPRAGGVHGPQGEPLVIWESGTDQAVADYIEKSGHGFGPGTDDPIRTQGNGGE